MPSIRYNNLLNSNLSPDELVEEALTDTTPAIAWRIQMVEFSPFLKERQRFCLLSCPQNPFWKGIASKMKEFAPKFFTFWRDSFLERMQSHFYRVVSPESVSILLNGNTNMIKYSFQIFPHWTSSISENICKSVTIMKVHWIAQLKIVCICLMLD